MTDGGPFMGVVTARFGVNTTPVPADAISYAVAVNMPDGVLPLSPIKPINWRPPPPRITLGAPIGSGCLVQFVGGTAQLFLQEWPAIKVCT